jgi:C-terminal processing protease CtpA/Prc
VRCGGRPIAVTPVSNESEEKRLAQIGELAEASPDVPSYRVVSDAIGYLRLPTFSKENGELVRKLATQYPPSAGKEKLLIVDARMNDGGDLPLRALRPWLDPKALSMAVRGNRFLTQSCLYSALRWGYTEFTMLDMKPPISEALRKSIQKQADDLLTPDPAGCPTSTEGSRAEWHMDLHKMPEAPRFLILMDEYCGSDCEALIYIFSSMPGVVLAGVNTYGVAQFVQPGYFVLPHTGLAFRIALGRSDLYGDDRSFDGYGFDVDVLLPRAEDRGAGNILELARRLLKN